MHAFGKLFSPSDSSLNQNETITSLFSFKMLDSGTILLEDGDVCTMLPFVIDGSIRVFRVSTEGREITLYRIEPGQSCILSSGCAISSTSKHFPATAVVETTCTVALLPIEAVRKLFASSQNFRNFVLEQYANRMADIIELVEEVAFRHVDERLRDWLAKHHAPSIVATHQDLADHVGTSREVVSRILKDWEQRGWLKLSRGKINLLPAFFVKPA